jgi:hypothetical protein
MAPDHMVGQFFVPGLCDRADQPVPAVAVPAAVGNVYRIPFRPVADHSQWRLENPEVYGTGPEPENPVFSREPAGNAEENTDHNIDSMFFLYDQP